MLFTSVHGVWERRAVTTTTRLITDVFYWKRDFYTVQILAGTSSSACQTLQTNHSATRHAFRPRENIMPLWLTSSPYNGLYSSLNTGGGGI